MHSKDADRMVNSVDPDQTAPLGVVEKQSDLVSTVCLGLSVRKLRNITVYCKPTHEQLSHLMTK